MQIEDYMSSKIAKWVGILTIISLAVGLGIAADNKWEDEPKMQEYATQQDMRIIQKDIIQMRIDSYEDKVLEIKDKDIDGTITNAERKKLIRYESRMKKLRSDVGNI